MPQTNVESNAEHQRLEQILNAARRAYDSRKIGKVYNFLMRPAADEERPMESLLGTPDIHLTTPDLQRKIRYIEARLAELKRLELDTIHKASAVAAATIAPDFEAVIKIAQSKAEEARKVSEMHTIGNVLRKYRRVDARIEFLINIPALMRRGVSYITDERAIQKIIDAADEAIILMDNQIFMGVHAQIACWKIVNMARALKYSKYQTSNNIRDLDSLAKYRSGAKDVFAALIQNMPMELQPLKVLYTMGKYELIERFLKDYSESANNLSVLIPEIYLACDDACRESAKRTFELTVNDYSSLPQQHRDTLEEQRAYLIMLRSYSYFAGQDPQSQELRDKITQDSNLLDYNIKNVLAQRSEIAAATQDYDRIKQELAEIDSNKRWNDFRHKTWNATKAVYTYPMSGKKTEPLLSNVGKGLVFGSLAAMGMYLGMDTVTSTASILATTATVGTTAVPLVAAIKSDIETKREKFPELERKLAFLERSDLNQVDKVFLSTMDQYMGYDPEKNDYFDPNKELSVEHDNLFKDMYDNFLIQAEKYIAARTEEVKDFADKTFLKDINLTRTLLENVLIAAGKTLAGLIFITGATLLGFLLAVGLTGPIVLFAMSPALSVGLVGAAVVAGLKYMYPNPQRTTMGFLIDTTVNAIFAPVNLIVSGAEILSRPIMALYNAYTQKRTKQVVATTVAAATFGIGLGVGMSIVAATIFGAPVLGIIGTAIGSLAAGTYLALTAAAASEYVYNKIVTNPKVQAFKLERSLAIFNLADNAASQRYAAVNAIAPELLPALTRLFKSEVEAIKIKIDSALSGKSDIDLTQVSKDLADLETWWKVLADKGNQPLTFAMNLEVFLFQRYKAVRDRYESAGKERAVVERKPYVEPVRQLLSFAKRPDFSMPNVVEYGKEQRELHDVRSLKHQGRIIKLINNVE